LIFSPWQGNRHQDFTQSGQHVKVLIDGQIHGASSISEVREP